MLLFESYIDNVLNPLDGLFVRITVPEQSE